jgi:hypothetical protein
MLEIRKESALFPTESQGRTMSVQVNLTPAQRKHIIEIGSPGSTGDFDPVVMSQLFTLGIIDIRTADRQLVLTEEGRKVYQSLRAEPQ